MKSKNKLVNKIKRILRRLGCPRWLRHFGPKTYELLEHLFALLVRAFCKLSYRRTKQLLDLLGIKCPSKSALQYTAKKLSTQFWQRLLAITSCNPYISAIDSTYLARTNPSYYYLKRIDGKLPKVPIKLSVAFDTRQKKFNSAKIRVLTSHDIKDVKILLKNKVPKIMVADKAYDARWLHDYCDELDIKACIPVRNWSKPRFRNMGLRMKSAKKFSLRTYHRRSILNLDSLP